MSSRGYACIGLDNPKTAINVGSAMRAAGCFGASLVVVSGRRVASGATDTMKAFRHVPLVHSDDVLACLPFNCVPVAIELVEGAQLLGAYVHPERAFYVFGAEDATLGSRILGRCRDVVQIETVGCVNLAAAVNIVLYDRHTKREQGNG